MAVIRQKTIKFPGLDNVYTFADEADLFDANVPCNAGEYRIYGGDLYRCDADHTGAWNAAHFTPVKLGNEVSTALASAVGQFAQKTIENVAMATFDDGAENVPVKSLVVDIQPVQAGGGDPAPDNVRPITGWTEANVTRTGKNLLVLDDIHEIHSTPDLVRNGIEIDKAGTYTISGIASQGTIVAKKISNSQYGSAIYLSTSTGGGIITITISQNEEIRIYDANIQTINESKDAFILGKIQIELGSTKTDYESPVNTNYSLTFPTEAGTVYGGTLTNLGTNEWKLRVERGIVDLGTLTWTTLASGKHSASIPSDMALSSNENKMDAYCSNYVVRNYNDAAANDMSIAQVNVNSIYINDSTLNDSDAATFKAAMSDVQLVYLLKDFVEYTITAEAAKTLLGLNNIWADTGDIDELIYRTMNNTDAKIRLTKALIAPVLDEMVAEEALSVNDFVIVGDTLYIITADVAADGTLTPGTNCTATTIGEQITALLNA